jgi:hypothetical protein
MKNNKWRKELTTVKVPTLVHEMFLIMQERYGEKRMGDAVLKFLEDCDKELLSDAERALTIKQQLKGIYSGEETTEDDE